MGEKIKTIKSIYNYYIKLQSYRKNQKSYRLNLN